MQAYDQQERSNKKRRGILEEDVPSEAAKAAYRHKAYEPTNETVLEYLRKMRRKRREKF